MPLYVILLLLLLGSLIFIKRGTERLKKFTEMEKFYLNIMTCAGENYLIPAARCIIICPSLPEIIALANGARIAFCTDKREASMRGNCHNCVWNMIHMDDNLFHRFDL
jgi:hypothetical protein